MTTATYTASEPITVDVYWDDQDRSDRGWAYRLYDGAPVGHSTRDLVLVESGPVRGRQTCVHPSRSRILASAGVQDGDHVTVRFLDGGAA
jgi:hypothetical protein